MARTFTVKVEGLRELDKALSELPKATAKNVLRRTGIAALGPMAEATRANAPVDEGHLKDSINITTKRPRRHRRSDPVEIFMGPSQIPTSHWNEYGTKFQGPRPFLRPAWDAGKARLLDDIKDGLSREIDKAAARAAKKQARLIAKTGG